MHHFYMPLVNEHGKPIERTPQTHPYSYDGFVTYRNGENSEIEEEVYSDRMLQWDYKKTRDLMQKHFGESGDYYSNRPPAKIESFLSEYFDCKAKLIFIMEYCNVSNGYPLWRFAFKKKKQ